MEPPLGDGRRIRRNHHNTDELTPHDPDDFPAVEFLDIPRIDPSTTEPPEVAIDSEPGSGVTAGEPAAGAATESSSDGEL